MKTKDVLGMLLLALLAVAGLAACTDDDGDWPPMKWKTNVKMEKEHVISVPAEGATYQFTCKNYNFWLVTLKEDEEVIYTNDDTHQIHGEWVTVDVENKVMTVKVSPNSSKQRTAVIGVTAGDIFDSFTFNQGWQ